jgi:hypothetical protein
MPFTSQELQEAGKIALDFYVKNKPIDQVAVERIVLDRLMKTKKSFPGGKQYVTEQLRFRYQSNFQWFNGSQVVTYNRRHVNEQTQFAWRSAHDGMSLDEDRLIQNGISVTDEGPGGNATQAEVIQLTNLLDEMTSVLRLGFEEKFSQALMLDGTDSADAIAGLDALVPLSSYATVGGIDQTANAWWQNYKLTGLDKTPVTGTILTKMEEAYRACVKNGGKPNFMPAGSSFIDGLRDFMLVTYGTLNWEGMNERVIEAGTKQLTFHGVPIEWVPEWDDLDGVDAPSVSWKKRLYMLNMNHIKLRPIEGQDMLTRKPPRPYDRYEYYWGLTWRGALTANRLNAHAALSIS